MDYLNLLIELRECDDLIYENKIKIRDLEEDISINNLEESVVEDRKIEGSLQLALEVKTKELLDINSRLDQSYRERENLSKDLYNGRIDDLKELEFLNIEYTSVKNKVETLEEKALAFMEAEDLLKRELLDLKSTISKEIEKIDSVKKTYESFKETCLESSLACKKRQEEILGKLPKELRDQYRSISKNNRHFIVEIEGDICTGCNMNLPTYIVDRAKNGILINCENCNRLVYKK